MTENKKTMSNESEFIFDDVLRGGFTVVPNGAVEDENLTLEAFGLYTKIIKSANNPNWKIYQSSFINKSNGKTKVSSAMKKLIECGYIQKEYIREKGKIKGVRYKVFSKAQKVESVENTTSTPKAEIPTSVNQTSENQPLIINTNNNKNYNNKYSSSSREEVEEEDYIKEDLDFILNKCQILDLHISKKEIDRLLLAYSKEELIKCLVLIPSTAKNHIAYLKTILVNNAKKNINQITQVVEKKENTGSTGNFGAAKDYERKNNYDDLDFTDNDWSNWED